MKSNCTRRAVLATVAGAGVGAVAGCSDNGAMGGGTDVFEDLSTEVDDDRIEANGFLVIDLIEDHGADQVAMYSEQGEEIATTSLSPEETRTRLQTFGYTHSISEQEYELVAYDGDEVLSRTNWEPTRDPVITDITKRMWSGRATDLVVVIENHGDLPIEPTDARVEEGFPANEGREVYIQQTYNILPGSEEEVAITDTSFGTEFLTPTTGSCDGQQRESAVTMEFEDAEDVAFEVEFRLEGQLFESTHAGCTETEILDWSPQ